MLPPGGQINKTPEVIQAFLQSDAKMRVAWVAAMPQDGPDSATPTLTDTALLRIWLPDCRPGQYVALVHGGHARAADGRAGIPIGEAGEGERMQRKAFLWIQRMSARVPTLSETMAPPPTGGARGITSATVEAMVAAAAAAAAATAPPERAAKANAWAERTAAAAAAAAKKAEANQLANSKAATAVMQTLLQARPGGGADLAGGQAGQARAGEGAPPAAADAAPPPEGGADLAGGQAGQARAGEGAPPAAADAAPPPRGRGRPGRRAGRPGEGGRGGAARCGGCGAPPRGR